MSSDKSENYRKNIGRQGYLTHFQTQFLIAKLKFHKTISEFGKTSVDTEKSHLLIDFMD